jgi:hypothetical protein
MKKTEEFYIGWQEKAPDSFARTLRRFVLIIGILTTLMAGALVVSQVGFADSVFELGTITEVEGVLVKHPVPMLKVAQGFGNGRQPQSILLIGFGKHGAEKDIAAMEAARGDELDGQTVQLRGTRIYYDGKAALELTEGSKAFVGFGQSSYTPPDRRQALGEVRLLGEILDPKCALGVMKPGYGKTHRSCAVRCISGGIPPVLRVRNREGESRYVLVLGPDGRKINKDLLPFVADQIRICGELEQIDDWLVLRIQGPKSILRLQPHWMNGEIPLCSN